MRQNILKLKDTIKKMAKDQVELKNQRKTVNLKGKRTVEPWVAISKHRSNRWVLRHLYIAYAIMRDKEPVYPTKADYSNSYIEDIIEQYMPKEKCVA